MSYVGEKGGTRLSRTECVEMRRDVVGGKERGMSLIIRHFGV